MMWSTTNVGVVIFIVNIYCVNTQSYDNNSTGVKDSTVTPLEDSAAVNVNISQKSQGKSKSYQKCEEYNEIRCKLNLAYPIYGGEIVSRPEEFPHMALLTFGDETGECAGSLISDQYILTAAHCTSYGRKNVPVDVAQLGFLDKNNRDQFNSLQKFNITEIHTHPNRTGLQKYHDIALLKLDRPVELTYNVFPACLHQNDGIGSYFTATGWGLTEHGVQSDQLLRVTLKLKAEEECKKVFKPYRNLPNGIQNASQLCAGDEDKDTCPGDSGGPLQITEIDFICMQIIIGITSFGKKCGTESVAVYTRVSKYIPWIESIVWP